MTESLQPPGSEFGQIQIDFRGVSLVSLIEDSPIWAYFRINLLEVKINITGTPSSKFRIS